MGSNPFGSRPRFKGRFHGIGYKTVRIYKRSDPIQLDFNELAAVLWYTFCLIFNGSVDSLRSDRLFFSPLIDFFENNKWFSIFLRRLLSLPVWIRSHPTGSQQYDSRKRPDSCGWDPGSDPETGSCIPSRKQRSNERSFLPNTGQWMSISLQILTICQTGPFVLNLKSSKK